MSNNLKTLPAVTVGATAVQITPTAMQSQNYHKWASVSIQSDPTNASGSVVYVGDSLVSTTRYSRALNPGDWWTISGSAIDVNRIYVVGSTTGLIVHPSGS